MTDTELVGPQGPKPRRLFRPATFLVYGVLLIAAAFFLIPLYVMLITSFKSVGILQEGDLFIPPARPTFEPWIKAWDYACTGLYCEGMKAGFWNSVMIVVPSVAVSILVGSVTGYVLAMWRFRGVTLAFGVLLFGMFIPQQAIFYPLVQFVGFFKIVGTFAGVIVAHTIFGLPMMTLMFRNYFASLPHDLFRAARIDGAGFWRIYAQVLMPISAPILVVALIIQTTVIWNDFFLAVIFANVRNFPMTVQFHNIINNTNGPTEYNVEMAAALLTGAVPLLIYFISGKLFVRGIVAGAITGK